MATGEKVFIVEHNADLVRLFDVLLREAGYKTAALLMGGRVIEAVTQFAPHAVLVDLVSGHGDDLALLDHLRTDPATRTVPVVAMSTSPDMLNQAVASYNVRQVLLKPFDLEDIEEKLRAAIERSPLIGLVAPPAAPPKEILAEVANGLRALSREMVIRWVQRIASIEPFKSRQLNLAAAIDEVPVLLEAVVVALETEDFRQFLEQNPAIKDRVAQHVRLRRKQGIPLDAIVMEYQLLREEIRCEIAGILHGKDVTPEDTLEVVTRKDYALDTIIRFTIEAYEREASAS